MLITCSRLIPSESSPRTARSFQLLKCVHLVLCGYWSIKAWYPGTFFFQNSLAHLTLIDIMSSTSGPALDASGNLKDAKELDFFHSETETVPLPKPDGMFHHLSDVS